MKEELENSIESVRGLIRELLKCEAKSKNEVVDENIEGCYDLISTYFHLYDIDFDNGEYINAIKGKDPKYLYTSHQDIIDKWAEKNGIQFTKDKDRFIEVLASYRRKSCLNFQWQSVFAEMTAHINDNNLAFLYELIQNADDAYKGSGDDINGVPEIFITLSEDYIDLYYNEPGMTEQDIIAITSIGESSKTDKIGDGNEESIAIGEKGIGFKTIFAKCDSVDVISGGYTFSLIDGGYHIKKYTPADDFAYVKKDGGTKMRLHIRKAQDTDNVKQKCGIELYDEMCKKFGIISGKVDSESRANAVFMNCPVMFTNNLRKFSVKCGDRWFSFKKEDKQVETDGHICFELKYNISDYEKENSIECFGIYKDIEIDKATYESRYSQGCVDGTTVSRRIQIIAALSDNVTRGNLYSYLPADQTIKAPFNVQLPIKMNLNRTRMYFIGDNDTAKNNNTDNINKDKPETISWNELMVKSFVDMLPAFYEALSGRTDKLYRFIPDFNGNNKQLFDLSGKENYMNLYCKNLKCNDNKNPSEVLENIPYFKTLSCNQRYCNKKDAVMFEHFIQRLNPDCAEIICFWNLKGAKVFSDEQCLVRYDADVLEYGKRIGLQLFQYGQNDQNDQYDHKYFSQENLVGLLNHIIKEVSAQELVLQTIAEGEITPEDNNDGKKNDSILTIIEEETKLKLEIFPAKTDNGEIYLAGDGLWIGSGEYTTPKGCFFHFTTDEDVFKVRGIKGVSAENAKEKNPLQIISEKKSELRDTELEQVDSFLCRYYDIPSGDSEYGRCKAFLETDYSEKTDLQNITDLKTLQEKYTELVAKVKVEN